MGEGGISGHRTQEGQVETIQSSEAKPGLP